MKKSVAEKLKAMLSADGNLTTAKVLAEAGDEKSPLHSEFQWNDDKAAIKYRQIQARNLIKRYNVVIEKPEEKLVHIPNVSVGPGQYKPAHAIVKVLSEFERAMDEAQKKLNAAKKSVEALEAAVQGHDDSTTTLLALAMKGLNTASDAIQRVH
jgi:hypothetical protein